MNADRRAVAELLTGNPWKDRRRGIMDAANARGLTWGGVPVRVIGADLDFARITPAELTHPLAGFTAQVSWMTVEQVTKGSGTFAV
jgi:hypothetical protein